MATQEHFLVLTNDYQKTWIGIFEHFQCIDFCVEDNKKISKNIFLHIDQLLKKNKLIFDSILYSAVNQGPGPFTTLRSIIASMNGLSFAIQKPLVGINGIVTLVHEQYDATCDYTIVLNNAFCNDVYYAILDQGKKCELGCVSFDKIIGMINALSGEKIKLIGSLIEEKKIELGDRIHKYLVIPKHCPASASLEVLGKQAYRQWQEKNNIVSELTPLYFKDSSI